MAVTTGFTGIGATLKKGGVSIANLVSISPTFSADQVDATHLLSTGGFREFKSGFKTFTVTFSGHFDPDTATQDPSSGLLADMTDGSSDTYKLDFTGADNGGSGKPTTYAVMTFDAVVTEFNPGEVSEGMVTFSGTLSASSAPTWGAS